MNHTGGKMPGECRKKKQRGGRGKKKKKGVFLGYRDAPSSGTRAVTAGGSAVSLSSGDIPSPVCRGR